jgi:hypothetical protein
VTGGPDERGLAAYVRRVIHRGPVDRRLFPWFKGTVTEVLTSGYSMMVRVRRSGEFLADGGTYAVAMPNYRPQVGDTVDLLWRDDDTAYAMAPRGGAGGLAPWGGWLHWSRYVVGAGGSVDTSSNPGGNIPLPVGYKQAWVVVSKAVDTTANTGAQWGGLQLAVSGGAIDTANHYRWVDSGSQNVAGTPSIVGASGSGAGGDAAFRPFVLTGGGTGTAWPSSANIWINHYSDPSTTTTLLWDINQINNSTIIRRSGAGFYDLGGVVTLLHFYAYQAGAMAAGTTFDLYVAS